MHRTVEFFAPIRLAALAAVLAWALLPAAPRAAAADRTAPPPADAPAAADPGAAADDAATSGADMVADAYAMTLAEAADLAVDVLHFRVADYQRDPIRQIVRFTQVTDEGGFVIGRVEPELLRASFGRTAGVRFKVVIVGASGVAEDVRQAIAGDLEKELEREASQRRVPVISVIWPRVLADRADIPEAKRLVPREADVFEKYIKRRPPDPIEGVWERLDGKVRVGIYRDLEMPGSVYRAMVLDPPVDSGWQPGDIKFEMELIEDDLASGPLFSDDRARSDVVWRVERENLVALNGPDGGGAVRYVRLGPRIRLDREPLQNGSGWVASASGHVVTNYHVIEDADEVRVGFREGPWRPAKVVVADERLDLAILAVEDADILGPPLAFAAAPAYPDGAEVTVLGYPLAKRLGEQMKVTAGVINGQTGDHGDPTRLQHSAATQPGSSGGPVLDRQGNVIGVSVSTLRGKDVEQVNFAIKAGYVRLLLEGQGIETRNGADGPARTPQQLAADLRGSILPVWVAREP